MALIKTSSLTSVHLAVFFLIVDTCDIHILSRASEAGSPTNRLGSDKTRGQGSFGPSTGGPDLQGSLQSAELTKTPQDFTVSDVERI